MQQNYAEWMEKLKKMGKGKKWENEEEKNEYYGPKGQPAVKLGHRIRYKRSNR